VVQAVLAILAEKKGSSSLEAIDIDEWCYLNSLENIRTKFMSKHQSF